MSASVCIEAVGVGHIRTAVCKSGPPSPWIAGAFAFCAFGVGHIFTASVSGGVHTFPASLRFCQVSSLSSVVFPALGVGQFCPNPDALAPVGSPGVVRSHNTPPRIIPHAGKVKQDQCKPSSNKHR
jgi:hypothetical protein